MVVKRPITDGIHVILKGNEISLVPRPRPAFRRLQDRTESDGKLGGAWERGYNEMMMAYSKASSANINNSALRDREHLVR